MRSFLAVAAVVALLLIPGEAAADHVQCGDVLIQDTTLDSDVVCPRNVVLDHDGVIVIGASNITFDARGFSIRDGSEDPVWTAVVTDAPRRNVTIKNIGETGGAKGIDVELSHSAIERNDAGGSFDGVSITGEHNRIADNNFGFGDGTGLYVSGGHNEIRGNLAGAENGGLQAFGRHNRVVDNVVWGPDLVVEGTHLIVGNNELHAGGVGGLTGLRVTDFAGQAKVIGNTVFVREDAAKAIRIIGGKVVRNNNVVCLSSPAICAGSAD